MSAKDRACWISSYSTHTLPGANLLFIIMPANEIQYSTKYYDDEFEYRYASHSPLVPLQLLQGLASTFPWFLRSHPFFSCF